MTKAFRPSDRMAMTVCVIGRNEGENLPRLIRSLEALDNLPLQVERIYVDSASVDESVLIAQSAFDRVFVLEESKNLCAAAGRHVGTQVAKGDWILYLDGDMAMRPEWASFLERICFDSAGGAGWVGRRRSRYSDGTTSETSDAHRKSDGRVVQFGGASLLPRTCVLNAGNWNPGVFSNEELELYSRMKQLGCYVFFVDVKMTDHFTPRLSKRHVLLSTLVPLPATGKKFYGFGQILNARIRSRNLPGFMRAIPHLFIFWTGLLGAGLLAAFGQPTIAVLIGVTTLGFVWSQKGAKYVAIYLGLLVQVVVGFRHYDPQFLPQWRQVQ